MDKYIDKINDMDEIAYYEMARLAMAEIADSVVESMDMSDDEFIRLREQLQSYLDNDGNDVAINNEANATEE